MHSNDTIKDDIIHLYITTTSFVLVKQDSILEIHFDGHKMTRRASYTPIDVIQSYEIYGILGVMEGFREKYLMVISAVKSRGFLLGHPVYVIDRIDCLSYDSYRACELMDKDMSEKTSFMSKFRLFNKKEEESEDEEDEQEEGLEQRLIEQVSELFSRNMFIFSPTLDITRSLQRPSDTTPLWKHTDRRFWWNEHITRDFIVQDLDEWIIPVMQGTIQIEPCTIEGYAFEFILISRRSRERAGMRYQRRGINEKGEVANYVETEQIVSFKREDSHHIASFIQTRGSIPLFWSQSPYSLHPIPSLERTEEENYDAFNRHFRQQMDIYGKQILVNLTELSGREAIVGGEYRKYVERLGEEDIKYVEFDFHKETKGMKFENISKLSSSLHEDLSKMQYYWEIHEDNKKTVYCRQKGVFRTNCMDCLDRTNVVQSAFGRSILNLQLMRFGISEYPEKGIRYYDQFERIFNNVWANNGDMISRMYAGTSALKGDFTRTGKRNISGMMNDASNSLARMYFNTTKDFWRQATVDFLLGYHKTEIFRHVPRSSKMSAEPGIERRWAKIRTDAIDISSEIVIADDETKIAGWTLLSPMSHNTRRPKKFEEKVMLLTERALYICRYNYDLEKVVQFKRLPLETIMSIQMGEYILSSLTSTSRSPMLNYGLIITHSTQGELIRWNTGSIRNQSLDDLNIDEYSDSDSTDSVISTHLSEDTIILKGVRYNILGELEGEVPTCKEEITQIVENIAHASGHTTEAPFVIHKPIISLEQAEKRDGIFKKMGYKIKQAIWT